MTDLSLDQVRERAREVEEEHTERVQSVVAILMMVVTVLAALTAYLETRAGTRESTAARAEQEAAVAILTAYGLTASNLNEEYTTRSAKTDFLFQAYNYATLAGEPGNARDYALSMARAFQAAGGSVDRRVNSLFGSRYAAPGGGLDFNRFYEDQQRLQFLPTEEQKASARERGSWASKRSRYVAVITIFAVALFLLGLTLTVPAGARRPFLGAGSAVGLAAAIWGVIVLASPVAKPSKEAIDAYVEGAAKYGLAVILPPAEQAEHYRAALAPLSRAIEADPRYAEALNRRGGAYFHLDLLEHARPKGSEQARDDFVRATRLAPDDPVAWGNLGAAAFYLGDYEGALGPARRAVELSPTSPTYRLNLTELLVTTGREREYVRELAAISRLFEELPAWARNDALSGIENEVPLVLDRPKIVPKIARYVDDVETIGHQIDVSRRYYGRPVPPKTDARVGEFRYELVDSTTLKVHIRYRGVKPGDRILYHTYVDGARDDSLSLGPRLFSETGLTTPAGAAALTLPRTEGWKRGQQVRFEVFVDGNLLSGSTYRIP